MINVVYTRNRCPTSALTSMTPLEAWSGNAPCVTRLRIFGCLAFAKVPDCMRSKVDATGTTCVFVGYCEGPIAYRLICLETKKIIKSRDVEFLEPKSAFEHLEECPGGSKGLFAATSFRSGQKEY